MFNIFGNQKQRNRQNEKCQIFYRQTSKTFSHKFFTAGLATMAAKVALRFRAGRTFGRPSMFWLANFPTQWFYVFQLSGPNFWPPYFGRVRTGQAWPPPNTNFNYKIATYFVEPFLPKIKSLFSIFLVKKGATKNAAIYCSHKNYAKELLLTGQI
ncbi:hypothetical protein BpHYR1_026772 [Brachionus plicatilis]|uniref:Uncharacterized protein n=1 Tax=Brachionus plicatilis TaxID=10195 RepID=A0A3M7QG91_BRAPC|nr:hypothetical protein BpHYR1_026772 [Brachionus plicatilis]